MNKIGNEIDKHLIQLDIDLTIQSIADKIVLNHELMKSNDLDQS